MSLGALTRLASGEDGDGDHACYRLEGHTPVPCGEEEVVAWLQDVERRRVAFDQVGETAVSTIFWPISTAPAGGAAARLFETAVARDDDAWQVVDTYATWEEAEAGHALAVAPLRRARRGNS